VCTMKCMCRLHSARRPHFLHPHLFKATDEILLMFTGNGVANVFFGTARKSFISKREIKSNKFFNRNLRKNINCISFFTLILKHWKIHHKN